MKHEFEDYYSNNAMQMMLGRMRKCIHCQKIQQKHADYNWGRVSRYYWYPKLGRCKPIDKPEE